jgi:hypothetical protein
MLVQRVHCSSVNLGSTLGGYCSSPHITRDDGDDYKKYGEELEMAILEVYFSGTYCKLC